VRYNDILTYMYEYIFFSFFFHIGERAGAIQRHSYMYENFFFFFFFPHIGERAGAIQRHSEEWGAGGADCGRCYYRMCSLTIECVL